MRKPVEFLHVGNYTLFSSIFVFLPFITSALGIKKQQFSFALNKLYIIIPQNVCSTIYSFLWRVDLISS
uniref:Putative product n=1 Tax=Xenopsylla cheopis TaxID=163159 RepID=A0A6M2DWM0_XENCH